MPILSKSKTEPNTYYTPDHKFKVIRCDVWELGWEIYKISDEGSCEYITTVKTLADARNLVK